ncbi:MAG TPA: hypothetical protein VL916_10625, partial [Ilumatobacteraceae bacterium]|nr:hypothetical protein [Ilumatobacteraceae bacterium]
MAFVYDGFPTTEVDLHDGGVWVTKQSSLLIGHFNHESQVLDGGLRTASDEYDILQSGDDVVMVDSTAASVTAIDPAMVSLTDTANVPAGAKVVLGGPSLAILDSAKGSLWVVPAAGLAGFDVEATEPTAEIGADGDVTVGVDGTVYAVSTESSEVITVAVDAEGEPGEPSRAGLPGVSKGDEVSISAIGDVAVVLDASSGTLLSTGGLRAEVPAARDAALQQPSAETDAVTLATTDALLRVPFDGSKQVEVSAKSEGVPAAPVFLKGCAYGAWSGSAMFVRDCVGDGDDLTTPVSGADADAELRFRVNRDVI